MYEFLCLTLYFSNDLVVMRISWSFLRGKTNAVKSTLKMVFYPTNMILITIYEWSLKDKLSVENLA